MSHPVDRLKELLFDTETRTLDEVQKRLSKSETDLLSHTRERQQFADRLDAVFARAGTEERFRLAVANVLDHALRHAEAERHAELSEAVAPLIVRTIRTEIHNSRDELVDALYPITGRMVKAYVASAIADLAREINRRVDRNPFMLRLRSLTSGKSVADLALADAGSMQLEEIYLIRRGTGELVAHWPQAVDERRGQVMSGVLAAINEFATDAFGTDGSSLREIDLGDARIFLRASPLYLLAARCSGTASPNAERLLDDAFMTTIERCQALPAGGSALAPDDAPYRSELRALSERLATELPAASKASGGRGMSPALVLLALIGVLVAGTAAWLVLDRHFVNRAQELTSAAIAATPGTTGYLIDVNVSPFGRRVSLTGLTRDDTVKAAILERLHRDLPGTTITDRLTPLPGVRGEIGPAIEQAEISAALHRTALRLDQVALDLPLIMPGVETPAHRAILQNVLDLATDSAKKLRVQTSGLHKTAAEQERLGHDLRQKAAELTAIFAGPDNQRAAPERDKPGPTRESARRLELAADQLATVTATALQVLAIKRNIAPPAPAVVRAPDITAFERLSVFVRSHAVFFAGDIAYRNEELANRTLDNLAKLMSETDALVRVVGYTDAKGTSDRNNELSESRARKIVDELVTRGIARSRLVAIGRLDANQIAPATGETSPNRRVEFELGFAGEGQE